MQVWQASVAAGLLPQMVYARIDIPRFTSINTAKGPWALLHLLSSIDARSQAAQPDASRSKAPPLPQITSSAHALQPAVPLEVVAKAVRDAALSILGPDSLEGLLPIQPTQSFLC